MPLPLLRPFSRQLRRSLRAAIAATAAAVLSLPAAAEIKHVIAISVDGLRGDYLEGFITAAPADFPNFIRLRNAGACTFKARCDFGYSETVPNHITMITGRPASQPAGLATTSHHGFTSNFPTASDTIHANGNSAVPYKSSVFDVVHDHGLSTALYLGKTRLEILDRSYNALNGALDVTGANNGRDKIDFLQMQDGNTGTLVSNVAARIAGTLENFTFLHITDPDTAGHAWGWRNVPGAFRDSIKTVDGYLGTIFAALDARAALAGKVAIILTGDHGGGGGSIGIHTDATLVENYTVPFFLVAPGVKPGSDLYTLLENRFDPATARPTYAAAAQPIRNGDLANLAVTLLGLPPIPGALMLPEFEKPLTPEWSDGILTVQWPSYLTGWSLEATDRLSGATWEPITSGITEVNGKFVHTVSNHSTQRFFRLRRPTSP